MTRFIGDARVLRGLQQDTLRSQAFHASYGRLATPASSPFSMPASTYTPTFTERAPIPPGSMATGTSGIANNPGW